MYFLLSPAKSLNETDDIPVTISEQVSQPELIQSACELMAVLKTQEPTDLMSLMKISDNIAQLNAQRNQNWAWDETQPFTTDTAKPAVYLFDGDVYTGLDVYQMNEAEIGYLNQHLGILSGLYGLLRPLDLILPYRLEMGTKLANTKGDNLYEFWHTQITDLINQRLNNLQSTAEQQSQQTDNTATSKVLINLASNEYFKSVKKKNLTANIITPRFEDEKNGKFKVISFYAKKARGMMVKYATTNKLTHAEQLKDFNLAGYYYCPELSDEKIWTFRRNEHRN